MLQTPVQQVVNRLRQTADDLGDIGFDTSYGAGRVNALRAVVGTAVPSGPYAAVYDTSGVPTTVASGAGFRAVFYALFHFRTLVRFVIWYFGIPAEFVHNRRFDNNIPRPVHTGSLVCIRADGH